MKKKLSVVLILCIAFLSACGSTTKGFKAVSTELSTNLPPKTPTVKIETPPPVVNSVDSQLSTSTSVPNQEPAKAQPPILLSDLHPELEWVYILEAIKGGLVELSITGDGLENIKIKLTPKAKFSFGTSLIPGLTFLTTSPGIQSMVSVEFREVILEPDSPIELELEVACADMDLEAPTLEDSFTIAELLDPTLSRLAWAISISEESFRVNQFAIWIVTNGFKSGQLRQIRSGMAPGSGPSYEEIERVKYLFEIADISIDDYAIF